MHENRETFWNLSTQPGSRPARKRLIAAQRAGTASAEEVGSRRSTYEPAEQRGTDLGGGRGGKGAGQGEHCSVQHEPDTERGTSVPRIARCAQGSYPGP